jgi:hypothetical protein
MMGGARMEGNNLQTGILPANVVVLAGVAVVAEVEFWGFVDGVLLAGREV